MGQHCRPSLPPARRTRLQGDVCIAHRRQEAVADLPTAMALHQEQAYPQAGSPPCRRGPDEGQSARTAWRLAPRPSPECRGLVSLWLRRIFWHGGEAPQTMGPGLKQQGTTGRGQATWVRMTRWQSQVEGRLDTQPAVERAKGWAPCPAEIATLTTRSGAAASPSPLTRSESMRRADQCTQSPRHPPAW